jgi:hypothetical protein
MVPQGWYPDPFEVHRFRFFRDGRPTALVMDDGAETYDEPPEQKADTPTTSEAEPPENPSYTSPAGWYNDPLGEGQRYWDGTTWSNVAVQSQVEFDELCQLSRLVNDSGEDLHDEPRPPEVPLPQATPAPPSAPSGWWQASDENWYPPEQHPNYAPTDNTTLLPASPTPACQLETPRVETPSPTKVDQTQRVLSDEWNRDAGPAPPPWPQRPFYKDPWFWVTVAAVVVCPIRRRSPR